MSEFCIRFLPENIEVKASSGEILLDVAARANMHINASCGGEGVCGRCRVELKEGSLESEPGLYLSNDEYKQGLRLACRAYINGNATIFIPLESRADASVYTKAEAEEETRVENIQPFIQSLRVELTPPTIEDNIADYDRLLTTLSAEHQIASIDCSLTALKEMPKALRDGDFKAVVNIFNPPNGNGGTNIPVITSIKSTHGSAKSYALAVDIGTTTIWGRLIDLASGEVKESRGDLNGQISFGEDVISRIIYAAKNDGLNRLQERAVDGINGLIENICGDCEINPADIAIMCVAGNTTMSHLFTGVNPQTIRLAPYVPVAASWPVLKSCDLGLSLQASTPVLIYPSVSSYVGGDIVAGVLASGLYKRPELTLFIDVGTNGEIVVGNQDWMTCAACSAGPAFEGGGVKFGMRAANGAIEEFYFDRQTKTHTLTVIGKQKPIGICGSGLINIAAELFMAGIINQQGKFVLEKAPHLIRESEDGLEYLLCPKEESAIDRDITLTEIDMDNLIRAKGAMYSGYQTLLESVGLSIGDLEKVIIAGGFGKSLNLNNAIYIGLLPELEIEKFSYIGNSSLSGATLAAVSGEIWHKAMEIKNNMTNFELSETPGYMDYYMSSQFLPHTQRDFFPKTMEALEKNKI